MIKLPLFKKRPVNNDLFYTVDVNSNSVKVLSFYNEGSALKITGSWEEPLPLGAVRAGILIDKNCVFEALNKVVLQNQEAGIKNVIFGIGQDVFIGLTTTIKATRHANSTISKKELDEINKKLTEASILQAQAEYTEMTGNADTDIEQITNSSVYLKINDRFVSSLEGETGNTVEIASFRAFSPFFNIKAIQEICTKCSLNILAIVPKAYTLVQLIKTSNLEKNDFVLVEINSDTTDVSVIFGKGIVATKTLNIGYFHFVEGISDKMGLAIKESVKVLESYCAGQLTQSEISVVQKCILEVLNIWIEGLEILFADFTGVKTFAPNFYVTGVGTILPDIFECLKERPWSKSIPFKETPIIKKLEFTDFSIINDTTGKIKSLGWLPVSSICTAYLEMFKNDD